jgi:hypothetical protein
MEWWRKEGVKHLLEFEYLATCYKRVYGRRLRGEWEYVVVSYNRRTGEPIDYVKLRGGKAEELAIQ